LDNSFVTSKFMRAYPFIISKLMRAYPFITSKFIRAYNFVPSKLMRAYLKFVSILYMAQNWPHVFSSSNLIVFFLFLAITKLLWFGKLPTSLGYRCICTI